MIYSEKKTNLFDMDKKYYLAHCISADVGIDNRAMGLGIVVEFNKKYNIKSKIRNYVKTNNVNVGDAILIDNIFNLITKGKYYGKPTYKTMRIALKTMKYQIIKNDIKYLAMPKIGAGLDRLSWAKVREMIKEIFDSVDIEILVCYL
ncbi:TPA: hypothetical protein PTV74_003250 [Clostridium botulinum]|nr:hypothetical protein [Clostridium botulinum]HDK7206404.1 hypothetical protein [Clostridium botulinum]HDK7210140.1 hypothetical protein [Clostridium botulinum]HDK7265589.1 hypothetical protein [Clostridium botulinum]HDK7269437.1 hypothetical protein [Clostridium botulinum]